jgi:hypothetical protein
MNSKDKALVKKVVEYMYKVRAGLSPLPGADPKAEPRFSLTKREIAKQTDRIKVRDVVLDDYETEFKKHGLTVTRAGSTLHLQTVPPNSESVFHSIKALEAAAIAAEAKLKLFYGGASEKHTATR